MAIEWIKLKMDYGARHIPKKAQPHNFIIEAFSGGNVELWNDPSMPTFWPHRFQTVRLAKNHCNMILKQEMTSKEQSQ